MSTPKLTRQTITKKLASLGFKNIRWTLPDTVTSDARRRPTLGSVIEATGAYCPASGIQNGRSFAQVWVSIAQRKALPA